MPSTSLQSSADPSAHASRRPMPLVIAMLLSVAMVGIYHDWDEVGLEANDFSATTEALERQDSTDDQIEVGTPQKKICFAILAMVGFYLACIKQPVVPYRPNNIAWFAVACIGWAIASYMWSVEPPVTLRELIRLSVVAMAAYGIARSYDANQMMYIALTICTTSVFVAVASEAMAGYFQPWRAGYRLQGGMHANMVAVHAALMALAAIGMLQLDRQRALLCTLAIVGVAALWITKSRSAAGVFVVAALLQWSLRLDPKRTVACWAMVASLAALALFVWAAGGSQLQRAIGGAATMGRQDEVGTLTGRLPLWETIARDIARRPLLGHGYEAFWTAERRIGVASEINWYPTDAHSIYFNTTLELGLVGLVLGLLLAWVAALRLAAVHRQTSIAGYAFFTTLVLFATMHGLTEVGCASPRIAGLCIGAGVFLAGRVEAPAIARMAARRAARNGGGGATVHGGALPGGRLHGA